VKDFKLLNHISRAVFNLSNCSNGERKLLTNLSSHIAIFTPGNVRLTQKERAAVSLH
jgi:hypothetical protein